MSQAYVPIRLKDFISGSTAKSDIFVCLPGSHYVKVLHRGQSFDPTRISSYEDHKIETVFLKAEDFSRYVADSTLLGEEIINAASIEPATCVRFLNRIADAVITELVRTDVRAESLEHAKAVTTQFVAGLQKQPNILMVFKSLEELGENFARHSIGVTMVATMMAMRLHWTGERTLQFIQCGGFLHDIGFRELPMELHDKPRAIMTQEELKLYESHSYRAVQILESVPSFASEVISIVYDHHEVSNGSGFPRALKGDRIYPLARLVSLADLFCTHALSSKHNVTPRSARDAAQHIEAGHLHDFPYNFWDALNFLAGRETVRKKKV